MRDHLSILEKFILWGSIVGLSLVVASAFPARAEDCVEGSYGCGHELNHEQFKSWTRDSGMSCCNNGDCRPTRVKRLEDDDGNATWYWWDGEAWIKAPPEAILPTDKLKDGRAYVCAPKFNKDLPPQNRITYCLSPSEPRI